MHTCVRQTVPSMFLLSAKETMENTFTFHLASSDFCQSLFRSSAVFARLRKLINFGYSQIMAKRRCTTRASEDAEASGSSMGSKREVDVTCHTMRIISRTSSWRDCFINMLMAFPLRAIEHVASTRRTVSHQKIASMSAATTSVALYIGTSWAFEEVVPILCFLPRKHFVRVAADVRQLPGIRVGHDKLQGSPSKLRTLWCAASAPRRSSAERSSLQPPHASELFLAIGASKPLGSVSQGQPSQNNRRAT